MFFYKFSEIFKSAYFVEQLQTAVSVSLRNLDPWRIGSPDDPKEDRSDFLAIHFILSPFLFSIK